MALVKLTTPHFSTSIIMLPATLQVVLVALICALQISGGWCFCPPSSLSLPHQKFASSFRTCKHNPLIIVQSSTSSPDSSFVPETTTDKEETTDVLDKIEKLGKVRRNKLLPASSVSP